MSLHRQGKVLVVEDDGPAREALRQVFIERDFEIDFASTATEAVARLGQDHYAAVVLDSRLPDGESWSVLEMMWPRATPIPVIAMVGMGDEQAAMTAYHLGAADCFVKGSGLTALLPKMVARAIERASEEPQRREAAAGRHEPCAQAQPIDSVGRLTGDVAHDFNNLLTAILGFCSLAMHQLGKSHQTYHSLEEIGRAAERAAMLVSQTMLRAEDHPTVSDPARLVRQALDADPASDGAVKSADAEDKEYLCRQL